MVECLHAVYATTEFLELFFENLLMNAGHELRIDICILILKMKVSLKVPVKMSQSAKITLWNCRWKNWLLIIF